MSSSGRWHPFLKYNKIKRICKFASTFCQFTTPDLQKIFVNFKPKKKKLSIIILTGACPNPPDCVACVCHITQVYCETVLLHEAVQSVRLTDDHILVINAWCHAANIAANIFLGKSHPMQCHHRNPRWKLNLFTIFFSVVFYVDLFIYAMLLFECNQGTSTITSTYKGDILEYFKETLAARRVKASLGQYIKF